LRVPERFALAASRSTTSSPNPIRQLNQAGEQPRIVEPAQQPLVLFGQTRSQAAEFAAHFLQSGQMVGGDLHPLRTDCDQRAGDAADIGRWCAPTLVPLLTENGAERLRLNKLGE
jgi:hypothetical protein